MSDFSHDNPGWRIAHEDEKLADGRKQVVDMNIAMQQIIDDDPWIDEPRGDALRAACRAADTTLGLPW